LDYAELATTLRRSWRRLGWHCLERRFDQLGNRPHAVGDPERHSWRHIMKLSNDWYDFRAKLDRLHPSYKKPTQLSMEFADEEKEDTGKGL
jgi:hypothetical protein